MSSKASKPFGENEIVSLLRKRFGGRSAFLKRGIGDDAAVIRPGHADELWVLTMDLLVEDVHFRRRWFTPRQLGHKSLAVNLSDVAAMGAMPRCYCVGLAVPRGISLQWIAEFYQGMDALGRRYKSILIGGDLSRSTRGILISISVLGESIRGRVIYRSGGRPGDFIYVTGCLGKSAAGLRLLEKGKTRGVDRPQGSALRAHREPEPRCEVGAWLSRQGFARALMDLSDGLSTDLPRMCQECGTGAEIFLKQLPLFNASRSWGESPKELALHGGEDYELLFAVAPRQASLLERQYPREFPAITRIGRLTRKPGIFCVGDSASSRFPLPEKGFDHFQS